MQDMMKKIQAVAEKYSRDFGVEYTPDWFVMKMQEELGELVNAHLIMTGQSRKKAESAEAAKEHLGEEIADLFCYCVLLAKDLDIDLEEAVEKKWFKYL